MVIMATSKNLFPNHKSSSLKFRWKGLESLGNLPLPWQTGLAVDLSSWLEILATLEENGADNDLVTHDLLVVVDVG